MFSKASLGFALALSAFALAAPAAHATEVLEFDLADPANADPQGVAVQSAPLIAGTDYIVRISGTGSIWNLDPSTYPVTCGAPESAPIVQPSPGAADTPATVDAAMVFVAPVGVQFQGGTACSGGADETFPPAASDLEFGEAGNFSAAVPMDGTPTVAAPDHTYSYALTGHGMPLQIHYADVNPYDNSGIFQVTILTTAECAATNCMGNGTTPGSTTPTPTTPKATTPQPTTPTPTTPTPTTPTPTTPQPTTPTPTTPQPTSTTPTSTTPTPTSTTPTSTTPTSTTPQPTTPAATTPQPTPTTTPAATTPAATTPAATTPATTTPATTTPAATTPATTTPASTTPPPTTPTTPAATTPKPTTPAATTPAATTPAATTPKPTTPAATTPAATTPKPTTPLTTTPATATTPAATTPTTPTPTPTPARPAPTPTSAGITPPVASALTPLSTAKPASTTATTTVNAQALLTARHKDACVSTNVLSIRLVAKKGTRFTKAAFWIDNKRVRTVAGAKLYVSKATKTKVLRVQKFRNLPASKFVLKVLIRGGGGKRYRLRQVYYRCTPPHKAAKKITVR